jgi:hypothetical protein
VTPTDETDTGALRILPLSDPLESESLSRLQNGLGRCPDVAFAFLADVHVAEVSAEPNQVLFVWLEPAALRSLRSALNTVSEIVSGALPGERFLDVVILNSAPELLLDLDRQAELVDDSNPDERSRALAAARSPDRPEAPAQEKRRRWWAPWASD